MKTLRFHFLSVVALLFFLLMVILCTEGRAWTGSVWERMKEGGKWDAFKAQDQVGWRSWIKTQNPDNNPINHGPPNTPPESPPDQPPDNPPDDPPDNPPEDPGPGMIDGWGPTAPPSTYNNGYSPPDGPTGPGHGMDGGLGHARSDGGK